MHVQLQGNSNILIEAVLINPFYTEKWGSKWICRPVTLKEYPQNLLVLNLSQIVLKWVFEIGFQFLQITYQKYIFFYFCVGVRLLRFLKWGSIVLTISVYFGNILEKSVSNYYSKSASHKEGSFDEVRIFWSFNM